MNKTSIFLIPSASHYPYRKLATSLFFVVLAVGKMVAQTTEELKAEADLFTKYIVPNALALVVLSIVVVQWLRLRKTVKKVVEEEASEYVQKALADKIGVDYKQVGRFFKTYEKEQEMIAACTVHLIVAEGADRQRPAKLLKGRGYKAVKTYRIEDPIPLETGDLVVFIDDAAKSMTDDKIDAKFTTFDGAAKLFFYGPRRYEGNHVPTNFANTETTFVENVRKAVLI